jgi:hypothetical protein
MGENNYTQAKHWSKAMDYTSVSDYYESAEDTVISKERAKREVEKHSCSWDEFLEDVGERDSYDAQEVLAWLGY